MARERMITRTVKETTAEVMTIDVLTSEVTIKEYTIGGEYSDNDLLTKLQSLFQTDTFKLVHINSQVCKEVLLGMSEDEFIRLAKVLPSRYVKKDEL